MFAKKNIAKFIGGSFLTKIFNRLNNRPKVLFYHGVEKDSNIIDSRIQANQMPLSVFEKQISYLKARFNIISLDEFYFTLKTKKSFKGNELVITFDDGYKNNLEVVAPILNLHNIPFSVFICPKLIDTNTKLPTFYVRSSILYSKSSFLELDSCSLKLKISNINEKEKALTTLIGIIKTEPKNKVDIIIKELIQNLDNEEKEIIKNNFTSESLMSWDEIKRIQNFNCIIGSHSLDHTILHKKQSNTIVEEQLIESKNIIEAKSNSFCNYFAFPNGDINSVSSYSVSKVNKYYKLGLAVDGSSVRNNNLSFVSRIGIANDYNLFKFQLEILSNQKIWR